MFRYIASFSFLLALLVSCSDNSIDTEERRIASFNIEGMVCEQGCGASLRKGLYATDAVDEVALDYKEERKQNLIHVHYTSGKTSPQEMVKLIEGLNEGQFQAQLVEDKLAPKKESTNQTNSESSSKSGSNGTGVEASTKSYSLPNLTELLNSLIH